MQHNLDSALDALDKGYTPIPILPGKKIPAIRWKRWQRDEPTTEMVREWFHGTRRNVAILCKGIVTVDIDDAQLLDFVLEKCGNTPSIRQTPGGGYHLDYRARKGVKVANNVHVRGKAIDLRAAGAYALIPPSENENGTPYRWLGDGLVPRDDLPVFRVTWARDRVRRTVQPIAIDANDMDERARRALGYVSNIEGAIAGQRGHDRTMRVAGVLIQKFRLDVESAMQIFQIWNETCEPPWSEKELAHKLHSAIQNLGKYS